MIARSRRRARQATHAAVTAREPESRRLLLDTQAWLWWQADDPRLGPGARRIISRAAEVRVSAASGWEIAIKSALGKLSLPKDCDISAELEHDGFQELPVELSHTDIVRALPPIHGDPFDRMLVAQAQRDDFSLVTSDIVMAGYGIRVVPADA